MKLKVRFEEAKVIERVLVIALGFALVAAAMRFQEVESQAEAWRRLYLAADSDAKYVNCLDVDNDYVICEKPAHGKDR